MKHLTMQRFYQIQNEANHATETIRGCRVRFKTYHEMVINECRRIARDIKRKPSIKLGYIVVYTEKQNLGTRKYADMVTKYQTFLIRESEVRETEKSLIIKWRQFKTVIPKEKIICYVW